MVFVVAVCSEVVVDGAEDGASYLEDSAEFSASDPEVAHIHEEFWALVFGDGVFVCFVNDLVLGDAEFVACWGAFVFVQVSVKFDGAFDSEAVKFFPLVFGEILLFADALEDVAVV